MLDLKLLIYLILLSFLVASCSAREKQPTQGKIATEKSAVQGFVVPNDRISPPITKVAGKPRIVQARNPVVVPEKGSSTVSKFPIKFSVASPSVCTPGRDGFSSPKQVKATGITFHASAPETAVAQNATSKDVNPHGFSSYGTIQGLKTNQIRSLLQDKNGNLWFSSDDGVTRYDGKYLYHFGISNGIYNNNIVLSMIEDMSGNLWFGTFGGGIIRFDGKNFVQFTVKEGLNNNIVNCIIQDNSGNYWIGTSGGGVAKFDGNTFTYYTTSEGLVSNQIRSIFQDKEGKIWIGSFGNGISIFDGTSFKNFTTKDGFPITHLASIIQDKSGDIWIGSYNRGLLRYDGHFFYQYTDKQGLKSASILCIIQDNSGLLWLGTSGGGVSSFDGESFVNYTEEDGLPSNFVRCSLVGRQGNLWFGTRDGGLVRYNKDLFRHYTNSEGLAGNKVLSIIQDKKNNLWFGSYGRGISKFDGKEFASYSLKETNLNDYVYALLECSTGDIWIGTDGGGITRFDGKNFYQYTQTEGLCHNSVRCILEDRNKQIWVGSYGGGVSKFDGNKFVNYSDKAGLSDMKILCMLEDHRGNLWFGTDGGGVTCYDSKNFTHYTVKEGLPVNSVASITQDDRGDIWFGTSGGGVVRFDGKYFTTFSKNNQLSNNYITSLLHDKKGNLWLGSRIGPNVLNLDLLSISTEKTKPVYFRNYSYDDGFLGIGCNLGAIYEDNKGLIWIGSTNRLSSINPKEEIPDTVAPVVKLTNIKLFNENIPWLDINLKKDTSFILGNGVRVGDFDFSSLSNWYFLPENLDLSYDNNFLSFSFIGISQKQTQKIRYQYQLVGLDPHWSALSDLTEVSYGNLSPGKYIFKVKAMNSEGFWSAETSYPFSIRSPWWATWWFYALLILIAVSLIYGYIRLRDFQHELQKKQLNNRIDEQTHELIEKNLELEGKNSELENANSEKDKFFSIIAHDVRGPLSTFYSLTEMVAENIQDFSVHELQSMVESMKDSSGNLFELVENLLEWARMQRGLVPFSPEKLLLLEVLNNSLSTILIPANDKLLTLDILVPADMKVFADKNSLASVFRNIIYNAVKFTPHGGKISIGAQKREDDTVEIYVKDNGIGMDETLLKDLFRMDVNSNRIGTNGEKSVGLGLLLCKDFVERQGGRIWAESEVGKGSTFYFTVKT